MNEIIMETDRSFIINTPAMLVEADWRDTASTWASKYINDNPALKWIVANYVEADFANSNGQMWTLGDLKVKHPTVQHGPMNLDHNDHDIVGTWVASELLYPSADSDVQNPFVQVVGALWKVYFPEVLEVIEESFRQGNLSVSMECVSDTITCAGENSCGQTFNYDGPQSETYCEHIREHKSSRQLNNPHFLGGAIIMPGNQPGWNKAKVQEISVKLSDEQLEGLYAKVANRSPHLGPKEWEAQMYELQLQAFSGIK